MKFLVFASLFLTSCQFGSAQNKKGFALYLLPNIKAEQLAKLDIRKIKPKAAPLLTTSDIVSYVRDTYEMTLGVEAGQKIEKLNIPVNGLSFIVFVDGEPIYTGAFWNEFSSLSFEGVAIDVSTLKNGSFLLKFELDFPPLAPKNSASDPRNDERILHVFKKSNVLFEQVWIKAKCREIFADESSPDSIELIFDVTEVVKSTYDRTTLRFDADKNLDRALLGALEIDWNATQPSEERAEERRFQKGKFLTKFSKREFLLKFERRIFENPLTFQNYVLKDFAELPSDQ